MSRTEKTEKTKDKYNEKQTKRIVKKISSFAQVQLGSMS